MSPAGTCGHTLKHYGVLLSCDLPLIVHSASGPEVHHDPAGLWWAECTLHPHQEEVSMRDDKWH